MIQKIIALLIVVAAIWGLIKHLQKERVATTCSGCEGCALREAGCTKTPKDDCIDKQKIKQN